MFWTISKVLFPTADMRRGISWKLKFFLIQELSLQVFFFEWLIPWEIWGLFPNTQGKRPTNFILLVILRHLMNQCYTWGQCPSIKLMTIDLRKKFSTNRTNRCRIQTFPNDKDHKISNQNQTFMVTFCTRWLLNLQIRSICHAFCWWKFF